MGGGWVINLTDKRLWRRRIRLLDWSQYSRLVDVDSALPLFKSKMTRTLYGLSLLSAAGISPKEVTAMIAADFYYGQEVRVGGRLVLLPQSILGYWQRYFELYTIPASSGLVNFSSVEYYKSKLVIAQASGGALNRTLWDVYYTRVAHELIRSRMDIKKANKFFGATKGTMERVRKCLMVGHMRSSILPLERRVPLRYCPGRKIW